MKKMGLIFKNLFFVYLKITIMTFIKLLTLKSLIKIINIKQSKLLFSLFAFDNLLILSTLFLNILWLKLLW